MRSILKLYIYVILCCGRVFKILATIRFYLAIPKLWKRKFGQARACLRYYYLLKKRTCFYVLYNDLGGQRLAIYLFIYLKENQHVVYITKESKNT